MVYHWVLCVVVLFNNAIQGTDQLLMFNPDQLAPGQDYRQYVNDPVKESQVIIKHLINDAPITNLIYAPEVLGVDAVIGLALFPNFNQGFRRFVGSLRHFGFDGHIMLGVNPNLPSLTLQYLKRMKTTLYGVEKIACDESAVGGSVSGAIRGKCSKDIPALKLEWGRFEMARRWLRACNQCTGWVLVTDTRDAFFQANPFSELSNAAASPIQTIFVEEISPYTSPVADPRRSFVCGNPRNSAHVVPCYGRRDFDTYVARPVLCSGSVLGTRQGMLHFLEVLVTEFYENNLKPNKSCKSPGTTDQWIMNWLYYNGKFGNVNSTLTLPWGVGPVLTVGKACVHLNRTTGAADLIPRDSNGFLLNKYTGRIAPMVHQFDRCLPWIEQDLLMRYPEIYQ